MDWPWLQSTGTVNTVANTEIITLPGHRKVEWMYIDNQKLEYENIRTRSEFKGTTGRPYAWTQYGGNIYLLPTPNAVYTVEYGIQLDDDPSLSLDADTPLIPDWAVDMLIADTCMLVAKRMKDREMESVFFAERERFLRSIKDEIVSGTHPTLPDRPIYRDVL